MAGAVAGDRRAALLGATAYLRLFGIAAGAALLAKGALASEDDPPGRAAIAKASFFAQTMLPEASSLRTAVVGASAAVGAGCGRTSRCGMKTGAQRGSMKCRGVMPDE